MGAAGAIDGVRPLTIHAYLTYKQSAFYCLYTLVALPIALLRCSCPDSILVAMATQGRIEAISSAVARGNVDEVARLLDDAPHLVEAKITETHCSLLELAAWEGQAGVVRLLIQRGAKIDWADKRGNMALHEACAKGHTEVASILLTNGADVHRKGYIGLTALMLAAFSKSIPLVTLLLQCMKGRAINEKNDRGVTALDLALKHGHAGIIKILLLAGADHTMSGYSEDWTRRAWARHPQCAALLDVSGRPGTYSIGRQAALE